jgi:sugar (pentulose or hexulose) kinase
VAREVILCADLGTGSLRVGAITAKGKFVATAAAAIRTAEPEPGWSVIDPEAWWRALGRTVGRTLDQLPKGSRLRASRGSRAGIRHCSIASAGPRSRR